MRVRMSDAHHKPHSLWHTPLGHFDAGLRDASHVNEIVDRHVIVFDPVLRDADVPDWIDDSVPEDVLVRMHVGALRLRRARVPLRRLPVRRWIGNGHVRSMAHKIHAKAGPVHRHVDRAYFSAVLGASEGAPRARVDCARRLGLDFEGAHP